MSQTCPGRGRLSIPFFAAALVAISSWLAPRAGLGQASGPAAGRKSADLLKSAPYDRMTLIDGAVFEIEPIEPRPLPPLDPKKVRSQAEVEAANKRFAARQAKKAGDAFARDPTDEEEEMIIIHLLEGELRDYKVKRSSIKSVEYFEDILLADGDRLVAAGDFARAFERYLLVKAREPNWKGVDERVDRLLYEEGSAALTEENARGLRLLRDLLARRPDYPGLADRLAASFAKRIERAFAAGEFLAGRALLRDLQQVAPEHFEARSARSRFVARAKALADGAAKLGPGERVDRLAEAARVWPDLDGLEAAYLDAYRSEPTLGVAVSDVAEAIGPYPRSPAAERVARLLYRPLLWSVDEAALRGEAPGQLLAALEVGELGKGLKIKIRAGSIWSDGSRPVAAIDVARSLADRALPASPGYNSRWADLVERVEATDEDRVVIKLARPIVKPGIWLLDPVGPAHAAADGWVSSLDEGRKPVGDGPFRWVAPAEGPATFHASAAESPGPAARVLRIREVRYPSPGAAIDALARGEVALLDHVPHDQLAEARKRPEIKLGAFPIPSVHRIGLDGRTPALRSRKLRRALSLAIDRKALLEDAILRHPPDEKNRVADGPFPAGSPVDAPNVPPFEYNPLLAKGLVAAARKELGGNPIRLTFEHPPGPEARATCPRIAEAFRLIGVEIELIERTESELESGLRAGRRFDLAYRSSRPSEPFRDAGPLLLPGYDAPPWDDPLASAASPRILQLLLQVDRATDSTSARALAIQVDRESRDELPVLPLWQIEDYYAWRSNLRGPAEASAHLYQGVAAWEIDPCYVKDSW